MMTLPGLTESTPWHQLVATLIPKNRFIRYDENLVVGRLANGLEYRILNHAFPPGRVHAHLVVAAGSLHEEDDQRGLAHFLEHCVFLGTKEFPNAEDLKTEMAALGMSFGGDLNAHTDFHETVYTFSCPAKSQLDEFEGSEASKQIPSDSERHIDIKNEDVSDKWDNNVYRCINLLRELGRKALLEEGPTYGNEKLAVISEEQMRNTIEYRVEKKLLKQLHKKNILPHRMPIGRMDQVKNFTSEDMQRFYRKWYRLDNMCIVVAGDIVPDDVDKMIQILFENDSDEDGVKTKIGTEETLSQLFTDGNDHGTNLPSIVSDIVKNSDGAISSHVRVGTPYSTDLYVSWLKRPGRVCLIDQREILYKPAEVREVIFQHDLLRLVSFTIATLLPMTPIIDERESFVTFVDVILSHILHTRLEDILKTESSPPFVSAGWELVNSARENCAWNGFGITCKPQNWKNGVKCIISEVARLVKFGVGSGELQWALKTIMKDFKDSSRQSAGQDSGDLISDVCEDWISGSVTTSPKQNYLLARPFVRMVTTKVISLRCAEIFSFIISYFDAMDPSVALSEVNCRGSLFVAGPSCIEILEAEDSKKEAEKNDDTLYTFIESRIFRNSSMTGQRIPLSLKATKRISEEDKHSNNNSDNATDTSDDEDDETIESEIQLHLTSIDILETIKTALNEPVEKLVIQLPEVLIDEEKVTSLLNLDPPKWIEPQLEKSKRVSEEFYGDIDTKAFYVKAEFLVEPEEPESGRLWSPSPDLGQDEFIRDPISGIVLGRLQNGIRINYKRTDYEPNRCSIRVFFTGGRLIESTLNLPPQLLNLGFKSLLDGGVSTIPQHIVGRMVSMWGLDVRGSVVADGIVILLDLDADDDDAGGGLPDAFALVRGYMADPLWDREAFERQKSQMITSYETSISNLEFKAGIETTVATFPNTPCMVPATPEQLKSYTFEDAQAAVLLQIQPQLMEVSVVGDFDERKLRAALWRYLGSLPSVMLGWGDHSSGVVEKENVQQITESNEKKESYCVSNRNETSTIPVPTVLYEQLLTKGELEPPKINVFDGIRIIGVFVKDGTVVPQQEKEETASTEALSNTSPTRCNLSVAMHGFGRYSNPQKWLSNPNWRSSEDNPTKYKDPSFRFRVWRIVEDIINDRLFVQLREQRGLCYACSLGTRCFDFFDLGTISASVTPAPESAAKAWDSLMHVLWELCTTKLPTEEEFNAVCPSSRPRVFSKFYYWMTLIFGLQLPNYPKILTQLNNIQEFYQSITLEDIRWFVGNDIIAFPAVITISMSGPETLQPLLVKVKERIEGKLVERKLKLDSSAMEERWNEKEEWNEALGVVENAAASPTLSA